MCGKVNPNQKTEDCHSVQMNDFLPDLTKIGKIDIYRDRIAPIPSLANEPADYETAARMAGEARRQGRGRPSLADALLGAIARRTGATVATENRKDFEAMGVTSENPLATPAAA